MTDIRTPGAPASELILTPDPVRAERLANRQFVREHAEPEYRHRLARWQDVWDGYNRRFFDGRLTAPHLNIGRCAPRRFSQCRLTTGYGGQTEITLAERVVFATDRALVRREYPAEGYVRFECDLLLGETVKQFVLEVGETTEDGYGGYGPRFAAEATRIGAELGLPTVQARRRGHRGSAVPVAAFWPWAFRPDGYYLGDIRLDGRQVAGLRTRPVVPNSATVNEFFLYLLATGRQDRLRDILERQVDADRERRHPQLAGDERGPRSADGSPNPVPVLPAKWVQWNDDCPARMAEYVRERRAFEVMPILADALEDAGCDDPDVLDHCRRPALHTAACWVLAAVRAAHEAAGKVD